MPCLIELDGMAKEVHYKIGGKIAEVCDFAIITTKDYFKELKEGAVKNGIVEENIICLEGLGDIIKKIKEIGDKVVLLEGRVSKNIVEYFTIKD
jgi:hypothetical protein